MVIRIACRSCLGCRSSLPVHLLIEGLWLGPGSAHLISEPRTWIGHIAQALFAGVVGALRNVYIKLAREVAERESSDRRLRDLVAASPAAIAALDADGNVMLWNTAMEQIFGWKEDEVIGIPNPIIPEDKSDESLEVWERLMRDE